MIDNLHNMRFKLMELQYDFPVDVRNYDFYLILSSSDHYKLADKKYMTDTLDHLIEHGTVRPNNFSSVRKGAETMLATNTFKVVKHHGYFRTLEDLNNYVKAREILNV